MKLSTSIQILVLLAMLTACSANYDSDDARLPLAGDGLSDVGISFSGQIGEGQAVTRAIDTPLSEITDRFQVWGHKNMSYDGETATYDGTQTVFQGYQVRWDANTAATSATNTNNWEYILPDMINQTIKYWDLSAKVYRFFGATNWGINSETPPGSYALYPYGKTYGTYGSYKTYGANSTFDVTMKIRTSNLTEIPYVSKLWFSTGNPVEYPTKQFGKPVTLEFMRPITRVRFIFTFPEGADFDRKELSDISFKPSDPAEHIPVEGLFKISYPLKGSDVKEFWSCEPHVWSNAFTIDYYEADDGYTPDTDTPEVYDNTPENWYYVLPVQSQGSYTLTVSVSGGEPQTAVVPAEYMRWLPGYEYTYRFKLLDKGGVSLDDIQVAISNWVSAGSAEHVIYNW